MDAQPTSLVFRAYGVTIEVGVAEPRQVPSVVALLPRGWERGDPGDVVARFVLGEGGRLAADGLTVLPAADEATALSVLDAAMRSAIAQNSPDQVFVHAGVVARDGHALLLPGTSWSGKTTLVAALVRSGATYFSDEFAVLDSSGRVHPYPKPLSLREPGAYVQVEVPAEELGAVGDAPADVALIAVAPYTGTASMLRVGTSGGGALALLSHAIAARTRSAAVLQAVRAAATDALYVEGERGEAEPAAQELLRLLYAHPTTQRGRGGRSAPSVPSA
jgi:hypothetical protein